MAAAPVIAPIFGRGEEERLSKLRCRIFETNWSSAEYKTILRDDSPSEVYSEEHGFKLYIGNCSHAADLPLLESLSITYVVNMAASDPTCQLSQDVYGERVRLLRISAGDMPGYDLSQYFKMTFDFIEEAREEKARVMVHCVAGASRSSTVAIAYIMQLRGWSLEKAGVHIRKWRKKAFPNLGFIKQLLELEQELKSHTHKHKHTSKVK